MTYTSRTQFGAVTLQTIASVDERIVTAIFTSRIPDYETLHTDELLSAYVHVALTGTKKKSEETIDAYLRKNGLLLSVSSNLGYVHFKLTAEESTFKKGIALIHELILESTFPNAHVTRTKALMLEENREAHDDAKRAAETAFINTLYPRGSYLRHHTLEEERELINTLSRKQLTTLLSAIQNGQWFVSVVGGTQSVREITPFVKTLARLGTVVERPVTEYIEVPKTEIFKTIPGKTNVEIRIGNRLPITERDDDYVAFMFGLNVLGKMGGFSGRLMSTVREKEGLTYGIYAKVFHPDIRSTGHWDIFTFFTGKDLAKGIAATRREIGKILKQGITDRELIVFKEILENQFLIAHESNRQRAQLYHGALVHEETESMIQEEVLRTQKLTKQEVNESLKKFLNPHTLVISGAGPVTKEGTGII